MATRVQRGTPGIKEEKDQIWLVLTVDMRKKNPLSKIKA
jgi:hypothetical protein